MKCGRIAQVAASLLFIAGCSNGPEDDVSVIESPSATPKPHVAIQVSPPSSQVNNGRQAVEYDPCVEIGDETIVKIGLDPKTRERDDYIFDNYSFVGCEFDHKEQQAGALVSTRRVTISASNITLDEFRSREATTVKDIEVGGRPAIIYPSSSDACSIVFEMDRGVISIFKHVATPFTDEENCEGIEHIAEEISSVVPAG